MSRIHEALKRAEQERAAAQGGHAEIASAVDAPVLEQMPETLGGNGNSAFAVSPTAASSTSVMPTFTNPFTFDTLIARCAQSQWRPDAKTMLFFGQDESAR